MTARLIVLATLMGIALAACSMLYAVHRLEREFARIEVVYGGAR